MRDGKEETARKKNAARLVKSRRIYEGVRESYGAK
jgi:hypothetical protein